MRRPATALVAVGLILATSLAVDTLGDLTQTRPDRPRPGWRSEVVFEVVARNSAHRPPELAQRLWGACTGTAERRVEPPGVSEGRDGLARVVVAPSLGRHAEQRLRGCLGDLTLDRSRARVVSVRPLPPAEHGGPAG